jgi:hypothetical protein
MDRREMFGRVGAIGASFTLGGASQADDHDNKKDDHAAQSPLGGAHAHFCGIHIAKKDPKFQLIVQHYCTAHATEHGGDDLFQCILFDSCEKTAKLLGVEYIISDKQYRGLPDDEKKYWHPHTYEVLGGGLIAPGMEPEAEMKFMKMVMNTWGKTWHTWPDPKTPVPLGEPLLVWALTGDGQVDEKVLAARDKQFNVKADRIRDERGKAIGYEVPNVSLPKSLDQVGRQWTDKGEDKPKPRK